MKVLLIEPDILLAKLYAEYLDREGIEVKVSHNGQSAITAIDNFLPDVIVLEIQLASNNGYEFLYELRSYEDTATIPVVINSFTPYTANEFSLDQTARLGVKHYLYKPNTSLESLKYYIDRASQTVNA